MTIHTDRVATRSEKLYEPPQANNNNYAPFNCEKVKMINLFIFAFNNGSKAIITALLTRTACTRSLSRGPFYSFSQFPRKTRREVSSPIVRYCCRSRRYRYAFIITHGLSRHRRPFPVIYVTFWRVRVAVVVIMRAGSRGRSVMRFRGVGRAHKS